MPRIYLVVQNNVRTGPFTLAELLQQPLTSNALIWIIGQSEDWLPPVEIPSLQAYFTQHSDGSLTVNETVLEDIRAQRFAAPLSVPDKEPQRAGAWDAQMLEHSDASQTAAHHATLDEATAARPKVVSVAGTVPAEPALGKMAALKERTTAKEEDNLTIAKKNWAVVSIALVLIVFITWNALFNDGPRIERNREYAAAAAASEPVNNAAINTTTTMPSVETTVPAETVVTDPGQEVETMVVVPGYASNQEPTASTADFLDSVQRVLDSQEELMAEIDDVYRKSFLYRKRYNPAQATARPSYSSAKSPSRQASTVKSTQGPAKLPLSQQVDLQSRLILDKNKQQVNSVELMVRNNSKQVLKTVSVDVYYYKKGEKLLNKETVYFSNLYPKQSLTKSIVGNQRATSARFQLGTITTGNN